jgi:DnaJ-class molecular chaperone
MSLERIKCFDCRGTGVQRDLDGHRWDCTDCDGTGQTLVCTECGRHGAPSEFEGGCWREQNAAGQGAAKLYPEPACSHCFGRGFIYVGNALQSGPEAQEEPPTEPCPKCNPSGSANSRLGQSQKEQT